MNVKLKVLSIGAIFFAAQSLSAQKDSTKVQDIDEVIVVGYGVQKKSEVTAAISQVKGSDIANLNTSTFEAQLAGRASGVQVTTNSGILGDAPRIRIRGVNTISSGASPLYVVDGIPVFSGDTGGGYTGSNALSDINPNDIESMEILKDGAATAIYGSRAANGVVLITTKKGKNGKFSFNYNNLMSFATPVKYFDLLHTPDFLTITGEKNIANGLAADYWAKGSDFDTDWQKAITRSTTQQDHYISFGGGTEKGKYFFSLGYANQEGIIVGNSMDRFTVRANASQKLTNWLDIGGSISAARTSYAGLNNGQSSLSGAMYNALRQLPNTPIYDPSTPTGYNIYSSGSTSIVGPWDNNAFIANGISNIAYVLNNNINNSKLTRFIGDIYLNTKVTNWLTYRFQASADNSITDGRQYWNKIHGDGFSSKGVVEGNNLNMLRWNIQNMLTANKSFADHSFNLTLVQEYLEQKSDYIVGGGTGLPDDYFGQGGPISNSMTVQTSGGSISGNSLSSYLGRFNYNYGKKYFIQASLRTDGLSKLPDANRWGTFPGVSAGWTVSNENFMQSMKSTISDLKFRASYAKVGNTDIGNYPFMSLYGNTRYGNNTGLSLVQGGNSDLRWETSIKYDYGVDLGLFNNRITLNADYFINDQNDIILDRPTDPLVGIPDNSIRQNIGSSTNKGFELGINADVVKTSDWSWTVGGNVSFVENEVKALVDNKDILFNIDSNRQQVGIIRVGESIRSLYGFEYWGVNSANGNPVYYKADGTLVQQNAMTGAFTVFNSATPGVTGAASSLSSDDKKILGNSLPKYFGAFNTTVRYKNFDFGALVRFSGGNKILNLTRRDLLGMDFTNNSTEILGRWQSAANPGDGWTPRVIMSKSNYINYDGVATSRFVEDGSFVKIDNISLGYTLPKELINSLGLSGFRIFTTVQNAFTFTKYTGIDPEMEVNGVDFNAAPRQRTISVGLNASF